MFCFKHHKDLVKIYDYIKNNKRCINEKVKFLNISSIKNQISNFIYKFNYQALQVRILFIYNFLKDNKNISPELLEYMIIFINARNPDEVVQFIYSLINDRHFYKYILLIFKNLSNITKCIEMSASNLSRKDFEMIIKFYNRDISKVKKILKISTYNLLLIMSMIYKEPLRVFKIKLGNRNKDYIKSNKTIREEFKVKYPNADLKKLKPEDKLGVMFYALHKK